jgi:hypothetical protein
VSLSIEVEASEAHRLFNDTGLFEVDDGDYVFVRDYQEHNASQDHAQLARRDIIAIFASGE